MNPDNAESQASVEEQFVEKAKEFKAPETSPTDSLPAFTEADVLAARREEKDKLYPEVQRLKDELSALKRQQDEQRTAEEQARLAEEQRVAEELKRKQEEEMELRDLLQKKEQEWQSQLDAERQEREKAFALLEKERYLLELQNYRAQRVEQERDNILPELIDLISGETPEQIEQSIAGLIERSSAIINSAQQAAQTIRRETSGPRVTAPPSADPLENYSDNQTYTPDQLRNMSMDEYAKYRSGLLNSNGSRGLFS